MGRGNREEETMKGQQGGGYEKGRNGKGEIGGKGNGEKNRQEEEGFHR